MGSEGNAYSDKVWATLEALKNGTASLSFAHEQITGMVRMERWYVLTPEDVKKLVPENRLIMMPSPIVSINGRTAIARPKKFSSMQAFEMWDVVTYSADNSFVFMHDPATKNDSCFQNSPDLKKTLVTNPDVADYIIGMFAEFDPKH